MRRTLLRKTVLVLIALFILIWPFYQLYGLLAGHRSSNNAVYLLFQVSQFQTELLNSYLQEAPRLNNTDQLNALKQAAYSVNYSHERLVMAMDEGDVARLNSVTRLMRYILRLQIGGQRPLKAEEKETLAALSAKFKDVYEAYGKLITPAGKAVSAQNDKLNKADDAAARVLAQKLLE